MFIIKNILLLSLLSLSISSFAQSGAIVSLNSADVTVNERDTSVSLTVRVDRDPSASIGVVKVDYNTSDGSARAGEDYTAVNGTLSFKSSQSSKTITVPITNDGLFEPVPLETFSVALSNSIGAVLGAIPKTIVQIVDSEPALLEFDTTAVVVDEAVGRVSLTVNRSGALNSAVNVDYVSNNDSATADEDYIRVLDRLTFARNQTTASIVVPIIDDRIWEPQDESFTVMLLNPNGGAKLGASIAQITIRDNDPPGPPVPPPIIGAAVNSDGSESTAVFRGGVSLDSGLTYGETFSVGDTIIIPVSIEPEPDQVDSWAEIFVIVAQGSDFMQLHLQLTPPALVMLDFDGTLEGLVAYKQIEKLTILNTFDLVEFLDSPFELTNKEVGKWGFFVGYTTDDGVVTFVDPGMMIEVIE